MIICLERMRHLESSRICIIKENAGFMPAFSAEQLFCYIASEESTVSVSIKIPLVGTGVENTICVSVLPNLWSCPINESRSMVLGKQTFMSMECAPVTQLHSSTFGHASTNG